MNMTPEMVLRAPAKINLGLEVLRRRPDGFHDLNTVFVALDLCDEIVLNERTDGAVAISVVGDPSIPSDFSNLCVRAATALQSAAGTANGVDIVLRKHIPAGAGLGGGSSDAAAVLAGAAELWGLDAGVRQHLPTIAAELGSDVPFFLQGGIMLAGGRGERLCALDLALPFTVLLVNTGRHVPTPWAYRQVGRTSERSATDLVGTLRRGIPDPAVLRAGVVNDFEPAVFEEYPELAGVKRRLYESGAVFALMSGSGSTVFGLFEDESAALSARERFAGMWTTVTQPL